MAKVPMITINIDKSPICEIEYGKNYIVFTSTIIPEDMINDMQLRLADQFPGCEFAVVNFCQSALSAEELRRILDAFES